MAAAALAVAGALVAVASAGATLARPRPSGPAAQLFWSEPATSRGPSGTGINTIWRANLSGSGINRNFVRGLSIPGAVAVAGTHVYWSDDEAGTIGRATLAGTHVQRNFIDRTTDALAVTHRYIYFVTTFDFKTGQMWRANLDGSQAHELFSVGSGGYFGGLAATASHLYWSNRDKGSIGRANINGTHVQPHFITGLKDPNGLATSQTSLYWASTDPGTTSNSIGRANINGTHVRRNFITGASYPFGVAVGAGHVYWANYDGGTIGRADLNGTHVQQHFISASAYYMTAAPQYIAVGP
jgi:virginiamycin B lyase